VEERERLWSRRNMDEFVEEDDDVEDDDEEYIHLPTSSEHASSLGSFETTQEEVARDRVLEEVNMAIKKRVNEISHEQIAVDKTRARGKPSGRPRGTCSSCRMPSSYSTWKAHAP
jgi:Ribonuclease G/E